MTETRQTFVLGTAGHVDHGKSTLVKALTSIDPDRLPEEKRRGMTIDLGFAYFSLAGGRRLAIVDVPGHQRFLKNMLAGVHGIDAVLLVIAADEGPMPQTLEHLSILDLLQVKRGLVVISKVDLVDQEWLELVKAEVGSLLSGSPLAGAPIIPVSSTTGAGIAALQQHLLQLVSGAEPRPDFGRPRLPIDRSFAIQGFGTVVTGTLLEGRLRVGDELCLYPMGRKVRVRGLQQHEQPVDEAAPGSRTAVNLVGVDRHDVRRGDVLALPAALSVTRRIDAQLEVLPDAPAGIRQRASLHLYVATAEVLAEVNLLEGAELRPGQRGWAQLFLEEPLALRTGDRFILRRSSPALTLAGGQIVDVSPRRHRRCDPAVLQSLSGRLSNDRQERIAAELASHGHGITLDQLAGRLAMSPEGLKATLREIERSGEAVLVADLVFGAGRFDELKRQALAILRAYHEAHPLRSTMPEEELRSRLGHGRELAGELLSRLVAEGTVRRPGGVALAGHQVKLSREQQAAVDGVLLELQAHPFAPPPWDEILARHRVDPSLTDYLLDRGLIVRVGTDAVYSKEAYERAVERLKEHLRASGRLSVSEARDLLGSSRKYVLPLLEWLDAQKVTRRVGDDRILRP